MKTEKWKPRIRRKDAAVLMCILMLTLTSAFSQGIISIPTFINSESLGIYSTSDWVPIFVLYDPPGNGSYSQCNAASSILPIVFTDHSNEFDVVGEYHFPGGITFSTPGLRQENAILIVKLNQTWELVRYSRFDAEWTQLELVNSSYNRIWRTITFDECSEYGIWVEDISENTSNYTLEFDVEGGMNQETQIECNPVSPNTINAGFMVSLFNSDIEIEVLIGSLQDSFSINLNLSNGTSPLTTTLLSDAPIEQDTLRVEGFLFWYTT